MVDPRRALLRDHDLDHLQHRRPPPDTRRDLIKLFTIFYVLIGIGILVELARQVGFAFVEVNRQDKADKQADKDAKQHPEPA